jgi:DNA mismatch repair protein MutS2
MTLPVPDLLCAQAEVRVDARALRQALVFGFAAGAPQESFDDVVGAARLPASSWRPASFARDLFVEDLVTKCLAVRVSVAVPPGPRRYVSRVLCGPPTNAADRDARRQVLGELAASPRARSDLERVYLGVVKLRGLLCAPRQPSPRGRRIEILRAARETLDGLASSFEGCTSGLARARRFGAAVRESSAYARLVAYLDHDEHMGSIDLRVRIGADGEVRAMDLVRVDENRSNPFHVSPVRRFFGRLALFFRGFRVTAGEVAERLLVDVFTALEDPLTLLFQLFGDAEVLLGALSFRDRALAKGLAVSAADVEPHGQGLHLDGLFNPLLLAAGADPVPCDVATGARAVVIVTGPNSGGKTRLLQSVAIAQLMGQAGLFVPARAARIPEASGLFASLFEDARADQPEGHLGMELLRIRRLFEELEPDALVVVDELCSGTNPSEGEEIARLVLGLLPELGVRAFVTTHLLQFAAALARERASEASGSDALAGAGALEFLQVELEGGERPTYRFVTGVAKTSLAKRTAARLGVTREELVARIRAKRRRSGSP